MSIEFFIFTSGLGCRNFDHEPRFLKKTLENRPLLEQQLLAVSPLPEVDIIHVIAGWQEPELDRILSAIPAKNKIIMHRIPAFSNGDVTGVLWKGGPEGFPPPLPLTDDVSFCRGICQDTFYRFHTAGKNDFLPINVYCEEMRKLACRHC